MFLGKRFNCNAYKEIFNALDTLFTNLINFKKSEVLGMCVFIIK